MNIYTTLNQVTEFPYSAGRGVCICGNVVVANDGYSNFQRLLLVLLDNVCYCFDKLPRFEVHGIGTGRASNSITRRCQTTFILT